MRKVKSLLVVCLSILMINIWAQPDNNYMDLLVNYVDGDYEKCLKVADKYISKDETKNDPLPYLYLSMSFYEMSRDHKYIEDYPNAYRECLNYLARYRKKDKAFAYKNDSEEFIEKIKFELAEEIENYELSGTEKDYRKSKSLLKKLTKIDPSDIGVQLMLGVHYIYAKDKSSGKTELKEALPRLEKLDSEISFGDLSASQQYFLKEGLIAYYNYRSGYAEDEAAEIFLIGKKFFNAERDDLLIENYNDYLKILNEVEG